MNIHTIILAGGKGTRMLSQKAKVLQVLGGRTMLDHVMTTANKVTAVSYTHLTLPTSGEVYFAVGGGG